MKRYNEIVLPGGLFARSIRALLKGGKLYDSVPSGPKELATSEVIVVKGRCVNKEILRLFKGLEEFSEVVSVFLHGSWADETKTPFSDIDDFVIIDDSAVTTRDLRKIIGLLNRIDMGFCRKDPLQHHGHWVVSRSELAGYDNSFIPLFILEQSQLVFGDPCVPVCVDSIKTRDGLRRNVEMTCENIQRFSSQLFQAQRISMYDLKMLVGSFTLMPAFLFQFHGDEKDKPAAIKNASQFYSLAAMSCIQWASECRMHWGSLLNRTQFRLYEILPNFFSNPHLWRRYGRKLSPCINASDLSAISDSSLSQKHVDKFVQESLSYVRE